MAVVYPVYPAMIGGNDVRDKAHRMTRVRQDAATATECLGKGMPSVVPNTTVGGCTILISIADGLKVH
jgi:hypothetical protein